MKVLVLFVSVVSALPIRSVLKGSLGVPCPENQVCLTENECKSVRGLRGRFCGFGNVCCGAQTCPKEDSGNSGNGFCAFKTSCKSGNYEDEICKDAAPGTVCCVPSISDTGIKVIKDNTVFFEYFHVDESGAEFIGFNHKCSDKGECRKIPDPIPMNQAEQLLDNDVDEAERCVLKALTTSVNDDQFGALVSLAADIGCEEFGKSQVLSTVNSGDLSGVEVNFCIYVRKGDRILARMKKRRGDEASLFAGGARITCDSA